MFLVEVGKKNGTDKVAHGYLPIYEQLWKDLRDKEIILLEIGIYNGNSIRTWCEWFPNATIVGIDHNPDNPMETDRAELHFGDQKDEAFLKTVTDKYVEFDIILDDASHVWRDQQRSYDILWPYIKSGGMYIIEDLKTSSDERWQVEDELNTVSYLTNVAASIVINGSRTIHSIQFYNELAVITKK